MVLCGSTSAASAGLGCKVARQGTVPFLRSMDAKLALPNLEAKEKGKHPACTLPTGCSQAHVCENEM